MSRSRYDDARARSILPEYKATTRARCLTGDFMSLCKNASSWRAEMILQYCVATRGCDDPHRYPHRCGRDGVRLYFEAGRPRFLASHLQKADVGGCQFRTRKMKLGYIDERGCVPSSRRLKRRSWFSGAAVDAGDALYGGRRQLGLHRDQK